MTQNISKFVMFLIVAVLFVHGILRCALWMSVVKKVGKSGSLDARLVREGLESVAAGARTVLDVQSMNVYWGRVRQQQFDFSVVKMQQCVFYRQGLVVELSDGGCIDGFCEAQFGCFGQGPSGSIDIVDSWFGGRVPQYYRYDPWISYDQVLTLGAALYDDRPQMYGFPVIASMNSWRVR